MLIHSRLVQYAIHEPVKLDAADWNTMIKFNFEVIEYLYDK